MHAPLIICTLCTCIWYGASAARLDTSVLQWASYVIAALIKGLTHESRKNYTQQELFKANLLNSYAATYYCYTFND